MRARNLFYLAVLATLLVPMVAVPAAAGNEDTTMWVQRVRPRFTGRRLVNKTVVALVHIRDETKSKVGGVTVTAEWTLPDRSTVTHTAVTNTKGIAEFAVVAAHGMFEICVQNVVKAGWTWDPNLDRQRCASIAVP